MENLPLHVRHVQKHRAIINRIHTLIHFLFLLALLYYRASVLFAVGSKSSNPDDDIPILAWALVFASELMLSFLWLLWQSYLWCPVSSRTVFPERLPPDSELPAIDVLICTADPAKEPTVEVMDTVLSAMSLDYPPEKLSVYLSDDAGSPLTLYAVREASSFARSWLPLCRKYKIEPRSPGAYFSSSSHDQDCSSFLLSREFMDERKKMKSQYELFKERVEHGKESFGMGNHGDHPPRIEVILGDASGNREDNIPLLVYVSREKRPNHPHNFKAGALNVLLRVSGIMSNAPYILVLDCDMYCNDPTSARQAMCFHLDHKITQSLAFVQFPQMFYNISKNDIYDGQLRSAFKVMWPGLDGLQGPILSGTGFYIKREALYGIGSSLERDASSELLSEARLLASCNYEKHTQWGKEMGFQYHSLVEDYFTGFRLHCKGWKSIYYYPPKPSFLGAATISFNDTMVQSMRWYTGLFEVGLSRFCPLTYGVSTMSIPQSMCYAYLAFYCLYSFPMLCYATIPQLCLFNGISLYPKVSSPWFVVFAIVYVSSLSQYLLEVLVSGASLNTWWNELRLWAIKSVTIKFFAFLDVLMKHIGKEANFFLTSKIVRKEQVERYNKGIFSFEDASLFLILLVTLVTLNKVCFIGGLGRVILEASYREMFGHVSLSFFILGISYCIIEGMFLRKDSGRIPTWVTLLSVIFSMVFLSLGSNFLLY
ncbi:PREDICTED: cellulose synthase-like protein G2 [Nelumbo nucifera]|uniref:Cellulose synthase-like protein G2 n=2 Tax=Nelumbo nucifera TaxID=4432 RepID=A0A822YX18_NELNU|nr:PREDICTED: cellulose synthase-like protein G2 [Nelumbo nucifera]DAD36723.1 TPA_asm: hypothetical protein HUJ06_007364 [Nelumbo nucifera]